MKRLSILQKLHEIEETKCIYDIHYCKAGVGFIFYNPPAGYQKIDILPGVRTWKQFLMVDKYYPTFEEAVKAEYKLLKNL